MPCNVNLGVKTAPKGCLMKAQMSSDRRKTMEDRRLVVAPGDRGNKWQRDLNPDSSKCKTMDAPLQPPPLRLLCRRWDALQQDEGRDVCPWWGPVLLHWPTQGPRQLAATLPSSGSENTTFPSPKTPQALQRSRALQSCRQITERHLLRPTEPAQDRPEQTALPPEPQALTSLKRAGAGRVGHL